MIEQQPKIEFVKVLRDCPFNKEAKPGAVLIHDFNILIDGEHRAILSKDSGHRSYRLYDPYHQPITEPGSYSPRQGYKLESQKEFGTIIAQFLAEGLIPTLEEINAAYNRRVDEKIAAELAEQEKRKLRIIEQAAPDMLAVLKKHVAWWDENEDAKQGGRYIDEMRKAIEKAERA